MGVTRCHYFANGLMVLLSQKSRAYILEKVLLLKGAFWQVNVFFFDLQDVSYILVVMVSV